MTMNHVAGNQPRTTALLTAVGPKLTASAMVLRPRASASSDAVIIDRQYPHFVEQRKTTFCGLQHAPQIVNTFGMMTEFAQYAEIGARLAAIRTGFSDLTQRAWAEKHHFNPTQWNNWEKGARRIPVENAEKLCGLYGLTLDFVYLGRRDGLAESASKVL